MEKLTHNLYQNGRVIETEEQTLPIGNTMKAFKHHWDVVAITDGWRRKAELDPNTFGFVTICDDGTGVYPYEWIGAAPPQVWSASWIRDVDEHTFEKIWSTYVDAIIYGEEDPRSDIPKFSVSAVPEYVKISMQEKIKEKIKKEWKDLPLAQKVERIMELERLHENKGSYAQLRLFSTQKGIA